MNFNASGNLPIYKPSITKFQNGHYEQEKGCVAKYEEVHCF